MDDETYLPTTESEDWIIRAKNRSGPCWRCRTYRRWLGRRHWNCTPAPKLRYIDE